MGTHERLSVLPHNFDLVNTDALEGLVEHELLEWTGVCSGSQRGGRKCKYGHEKEKMKSQKTNKPQSKYKDSQ